MTKSMIQRQLKTLKYFFIISLPLISSCDCIQRASGVVLDKQTGQPIQNVSLGKYVADDPNNVSIPRALTNANGQFNYSGISGGLFGCPDIQLYFNKERYRQVIKTFSSFSSNDTIFLEKL
ncbi:MAG: hypothetical protein JWO06_2161 [Bacteroidota bacterium]|nr:hypothetical protein [Bacteroidota bacterium]